MYIFVSVTNIFCFLNKYLRIKLNLTIIFIISLYFYVFNYNRWKEYCSELYNFNNDKNTSILNATEPTDNDNYPI